ncbi:hypothetical protein [Clostridium grantii]|uniref:hypothetical protein n=1 Tax=Clostridium grantii TaxID=40575 RepID=UPI0011604EFF|nr:hypothetical protein [Clostridium grantii]
MNFKAIICHVHDDSFFLSFTTSFDVALPSQPGFKQAIKVVLSPYFSIIFYTFYKSIVIVRACSIIFEI